MDSAAAHSHSPSRRHAVDPRAEQQRKLQEFLRTMLPRNYGEHRQPRITTSQAQQLIINSHEILVDAHDAPQRTALGPGDLPKRVLALKNYFTQHPLNVERAALEASARERKEAAEAQERQLRNPHRQLKGVVAAVKARRAFGQAPPSAGEQGAQTAVSDQQNAGARQLAEGLLPSAVADLSALNRHYSTRREDYDSVTHYEVAMEREERAACEIVESAVAGSAVGARRGSRAVDTIAATRRRSLMSSSGDSNEWRWQLQQRHRASQLGLSASSSAAGRAGGATTPIGGIGGELPLDIVLPLADVTAHSPAPSPAARPTRSWEVRKTVEFGKIILDQMNNRNVVRGKELMCPSEAREKSRRTCTKDAHPQVTLLEAMQRAQQTGESPLKTANIRRRSFLDASFVSNGSSDRDQEQQTSPSVGVSPKTSFSQMKSPLCGKLLALERSTFAPSAAFAASSLRPTTSPAVAHVADGCGNRLPRECLEIYEKRRRFQSIDPARRVASALPFTSKRLQL